ncbi:MAG: hypothetical protein GXX90_02225 [Microbacteriaceae bacterium]|nr:hypothetical protein [Microbacteriaceae bacterium]
MPTQKPMTTPQPSDERTDAPIGRVERVLAYTAITVAALALISLAIVFIAPLVGAEYGDPPAWYWDALMAVGYYGFGIAFLSVVALLLVRMLSNRRANR